MNKEEMTEKLNDRDWILAHITIALQRDSDDAIIKKPTEFDGIEQYLILMEDHNESSYSIKVTPALLSHADIDEEEAWTMAMVQLEHSVEIKTLKEVIMALIPGEYDDLPDEQVNSYIMTTSRRTKGASAVLIREPLRKLAEENGVDQFIILPSSIHEMIVIPCESSQNSGDFTSMVKEINDTLVAPEERLTDRAYLISV